MKHICEHENHHHHHHHYRHCHHNHHNFEEKREVRYQFILLHDDQPIGCMKAYKDDELEPEIVMYICGMKNTFHIFEDISKHEMIDFLRLASSRIFSKTYFIARTSFPGDTESRELFCTVQNVTSELLIAGSLTNEPEYIEDNELEPPNFDIYPDKYDEDNEASNVDSDDTENIKVLEEIEEGDVSENNEPEIEDDFEIDTTTSKDFTTEDKNDLHGENRNGHFKRHKPNVRYYDNDYNPVVNLCIEDSTYGVLLDIDITGFVDAHHKHHHRPRPNHEFDQDPTDDMNLSK